MMCLLPSTGESKNSESSSGTVFSKASSPSMVLYFSRMGSSRVSSVAFPASHLQPRLHGPRHRRTRATSGELPMKKIFYHVLQNPAVGQAELAINQERER